LEAFGVKLAAGPDLNLLASFGESSGGTIGAVGDDGVEGIGDREDACTQRNFGAFETAGVAGTVEVFLMGIDNVASFGEKRDFLEHLVAVIAVLAHEGSLVVVELSR